MKKVIVIAMAVALIVVSSAFGAIQVLRAVSELDAPGTVYQNRVQLANGASVPCLFFRARATPNGVSMDCDWDRRTPAP